MRPIAMINQKGGVGKTTTAVNVAAALARQGRRVLLVDLDPQAHATVHLGIELPSDGPSTYDIIVNGMRAAEILRETAENLTLVPAHIDLVASEVELVGRPERELILRRALAPLHDRFDFLIVDCPPSLGILTVNALAAVDEIIIPLQPHFLALQGLGRLLETVWLVRGVLNPSLRVAGIVFCMYEKGTRLAQEVDKDVRHFMANASPEDAWHGARVFDTVIRRNVKLAECPSFGRTIFDYAPKSHGARDYHALAREMLEMTLPTAEEHAEEPDQVGQPSQPEVSSATAETADQRAAAETLVLQQASADAEGIVPAGSQAIPSGPSATTDPLAPPAPPDARAPVTPDAAAPDMTARDSATCPRARGRAGSKPAARRCRVIPHRDL